MNSVYAAFRLLGIFLIKDRMMPLVLALIAESTRKYRRPPSKVSPTVVEIFVGVGSRSKTKAITIEAPRYLAILAHGIIKLRLFRAKAYRTIIRTKSAARTTVTIDVSASMPTSAWLFRIVYVNGRTTAALMYVKDC